MKNNARLVWRIVARCGLLPFVFTAIGNIQRHPGESRLINISLFTIVFFTVLTTASVTVSIIQYRKEESLQKDDEWNEEATW
ncbi:MAG: hypothetical protein EBZ77_11995 [Chitinophagia bacterium]|nr:hypothetical protein [Chitinophagia bacterium]